MNQTTNKMCYIKKNEALQKKNEAERGNTDFPVRTALGPRIEIIVQLLA